MLLDFCVCVGGGDCLGDARVVLLLQAIRVLVSSDNATSRHPLLVTVRQPVGVVSWAVPYTESG